MMKNKYCISFIFMTVFVLAGNSSEAVFAQGSRDIDEKLVKASELIENADEPAALKIYNEVLEKDPENFEALWNASLLNSRKGHRQEDESDKREGYEKGLELAKKCLKYHPDRAESHYVYAVAAGRIANISGARERVKSSGEIKDHAEKALDIDEEHDGAWHLLGVWHTSAANLSRPERWVANLLFGGLPPGASNEKAEECLKKAIELNPESILYHLDLARHYIEVDQTKKAIQTLEKLMELEPRVMDDPRYIEEAEELLGELR